MDCENYEALAVDLLYGELSPEKRADASAHAASCSECGKLSKELDEARKTAASLPARMTPPAELDERIMLAARMAADVRKQPLRGGGLHVAAAAVMAALLVGVSFVVGMQVGRPKRIAPQGGGDEPITRAPKDPNAVDIGDTPSSPPRHVSGGNVPLNEMRKYQEGLLAMANEDLARGDAKRALVGFAPVFSNGGRSQMALEARIGMAKCYRALGQLEEARAALRDAREKNMDWGTNFDNVEAEASKLIPEINREILERDQKKLEKR